MRPSRHRGVSLVETTMTAALVAVLATAALPSLHDQLMQHALRARSGELTTDLHFLRSEALASGNGLRISVQRGPAGSCYVLHRGPGRSCDCLHPDGAKCSAEGTSIKSVFMPADAAVRFDANVSTMLFDPVHGTSSPAGWIEVTDRRGRGMRHVVGALGRVRTCSLERHAAGVAPC